MPKAFEVLTKFTAKDNSTKTIKNIGTAAKATALAIGLVSISAVKLASDFDQGLRKTSTIMDQTQMSFKEMSDGVLQISDRTGRAVNILTEAQYQAISAGVATKDSLSFVEQASKAAIGGFTDEATAVDGLTTVLNAYGMEADKVAKISDQMIATQNFGKTTFGELASSLGKVVPTASAMQVGTEQLFSALAAMTKQGIATSEATTSMNGVLKTFLKPTKEAQKAARAMGIDLSSAAIKSKGFANVMADVAKKTGGSEEKLAMLFTDIEALKGALVLTGGKGAQDFSAGLDLIANSAGATSEAFKKMNDSPTAKFNIALARLTNAGIRIGLILMPVATRLANWVSDMTMKFSELDTQTQTFIVGFGAVIGVVGSLAFAIPPLVTAFTTVKGVIIGAKVAMFAFNAVVMANPIGASIGAILLFAGAFYLLQKRVGGVVPALKLWGQALLQQVLFPLNIIIKAWQLFLTLVSKVQGLIGLDGLSDFTAGISSRIGNIQDQANLAITGTTSILPGSKLLEAFAQGDAEDTRTENEFGLGLLSKIGQGVKSSIDLNISNSTGLPMETEASTDFGVLNTNLDSGAQ